MTYKEALEQLKYEIEEEGHCSYIEDEMKVAFEALEKQIPKSLLRETLFVTKRQKTEGKNMPTISIVLCVI